MARVVGEDCAPESVRVTRAALDDVEAVAPLFDRYRQFYRLDPDRDTARAWIRERLGKDESVVLVARDARGRAIGFTQCYRSFCSLAAAPIWILYDLFVSPDARRRGVAAALMNAAADAARRDGAVRIRLETHRDNASARALYRSLGYRRDEQFLVFELDLGDR